MVFLSRNLWRMRCGQRLVVARVARASSASPAAARARCAAKAARLAGVARVEHAAVGQHDAHAGQRVVAVLRRAAAHAAGVVGGDAADHRRVDRRRVGADLAAQRREPAVGRRADDAGLQRDRLRVVGDRAAAPAVAQQHQHRVADRLARQAGAGGAEGHRRAGARAACEHAPHFGLALDHAPRSWAPGGRSWRRVPQASRRSGSVISRCGGMNAPSWRCSAS